MSTSVALHLVIVVACGDDHEISANKFQVCSFQLPGLIRASKYHMSSWGPSTGYITKIQLMRYKDNVSSPLAIQLVTCGCRYALCLIFFLRFSSIVLEYD